MGSLVKVFIIETKLICEISLYLSVSLYVLPYATVYSIVKTL